MDLEGRCNCNSLPVLVQYLVQHLFVVMITSHLFSVAHKTLLCVVLYPVIITKLSSSTSA